MPDSLFSLVDILFGMEFDTVRVCVKSCLWSECVRFDALLGDLRAAANIDNKVNTLRV